MATVNVEFSDASKTVISMYFSASQDPDIYPNQGEVDTSDPMWKTFYEAVSGIAQGLPAPT